ncbi:hypothetical protein [Microbulbifer epialgicus]|uniref:Uncharacterized protein n=1 Tax=Microbulbifer epialgicus TaxID=393907 RepID=A0ABV4P2Q0_9GAMM
MYNSLLIASLLAATAPQNICSDGIALVRGVAAITAEYPWHSANKNDYLVRSYPRMYIIVPRKLEIGGSPTATINKEDCQVINIYLSR